jgi:hypothetical protein
MSKGTGRIVYTAKQEHVCRPGWEQHVTTGGDSFLSLPAGMVTLHELDLPPGTVWECTCGKFYVAVAMKKWEDPGLVRHRIRWRLEKRRERRRRERQ